MAKKERLSIALCHIKRFFKLLKISTSSTASAAGRFRRYQPFVGISEIPAGDFDRRNLDIVIVPCRASNTSVRTVLAERARIGKTHDR
jgi:hypothetical protein